VNVSKHSHAEFWDSSPCDAQGSYADRFAFRYNKDTWLLDTLKEIGSAGRNVLEVGCGQGTDGVTLCRFLQRRSRYTGVDQSTVSLDRARAAAAEARHTLAVTPEFRLADAEHLPFADATFDCVLSVGALHHSPDTYRAVCEVHRVLAPGGKAYVMLYRTLSPKLLAAHALRSLQAGCDTLLRTDRIFYRLARSWVIGEATLGTAIYECFGVPILRSYTRRGMRRLFGDFRSIRLTARSVGVPPAALSRRLDRLQVNPLGYIWVAELEK
jgi:ubiquinone/menaquinone biosynthesis C-methylase UbiE